jgi:tripartite-type tricarboxylate transporter receptor subunit TctC
MPSTGIGRRALLAAGAAMVVRPALAREELVLMVGARAGTAADRAVRALAPFLERHLGHTRVNVLNHPGEGGLAAFRALADAPASGSILGWVATPSLPARTVDCPGAAALLARLRLIGTVAKEPIALVSAADSPLVSAQDIIRRSAENADAVPLGTPPAGSPPHLAALRLQAVAGTKLNIVAFPSAAAARQAALAGHVAAAALALGDAIESLREGTLTGLGIAARDRADAFPQMPPLRESGLHLSAFIRRGLAAPAAIAEAVAAPLAAALREVVADPEFHAEAEADGFIAAWLDGPAWAAQTLSERADLARLWQDEPWRPSAIL